MIKESEVKALCAKAREILVEESNVQRVDSPVTVSTFIHLFILNVYAEVRGNSVECSLLKSLQFCQIFSDFIRVKPAFISLFYMIFKKNKHVIWFVRHYKFRRLDFFCFAMMRLFMCSGMWRYPWTVL